MPLFLPDPDGYDPDDLVEDLGAGLAARYAEAEDALIAAAARRAYRIIALEREGAEAATAIERQRALRDAELARAAALSELRKIAAAEVARIRRESLAETLIQTAARDGESAAAAMLLPLERAAGTIPLSAARAVGALTLDLQSKLDVLDSRITRFPNDVYQQVMSAHSPRLILGIDTTLGAQQKAVRDFLSRGIGSINYLRKDGSVHLVMPIGSYAEMVGRTSAQRAWQDAGIYRMQQVGVNLGTIVGGLDACARCAPWIGKIVSLDGTTGTVTVPHATQPGTVPVTIHGTVDEARASGWGHPNCRDRIVAYSPGLTIPQSGVQHDPAAEKERAEQRKLEREIRAAKRRELLAPNDIDRARATADVRDAQAAMREFIDRTGRQRKSYREQLHFADGPRRR
jgi:hypothetical protein